MANGGSASGEDEYGQLAGATDYEARMAYRRAVARRDECLRAYVTLYLYVAMSSRNSSAWQLESVSAQIAPSVTRYDADGGLGSQRRGSDCACSASCGR